VIRGPKLSDDKRSQSVRKAFAKRLQSVHKAIAKITTKRLHREHKRKIEKWIETNFIPTTISKFEIIQSIDGI
jgi:hypothetical protein